MITLPDDLVDKTNDCWIWLGGRNGDAGEKIFCVFSHRKYDPT